MPDSRPLTDELLTAYRNTRYRVYAPGRELVLGIDRYDEGLSKLLREAWVDSAALLTAWNPDSKPHPLEENRRRQKELVRELEAAGCPCLGGRNEPGHDAQDGPDWTEESVLALDLNLQAARRIAQRYGQLAFLWTDRQATPRLIITAAPDTA